MAPSCPYRPSHNGEADSIPSPNNTPLHPKGANLSIMETRFQCAVHFKWTTGR